jgi:hypothetical protein
MRGRYLAEGLYDYRRRPRLRPHADSGCALHIQDIHTNQKWVIRSFDKLFRQLLKLAMQSIRKRRARSTIGCRSARGRAVIGAVNGGTCVRHRGRHRQPLSLRSVRALLRCNPRSASCRTAVATSRSCGCSRAWRGFPLGGPRGSRNLSPLPIFYWSCGPPRKGSLGADGRVINP